MCYTHSKRICLQHRMIRENISINFTFTIAATILFMHIFHSQLRCRIVSLLSDSLFVPPFSIISISIDILYTYIFVCCSLVVNFLLFLLSYFFLSVICWHRTCCLIAQCMTCSMYDVRMDTKKRLYFFFALSSYTWACVSTCVNRCSQMHACTCLCMCAYVGLTAHICE